LCCCAIRQIFTPNFHPAHLGVDLPHNPRRRLKDVTDAQKSRDPEATPQPRPQGPSFGLMLAIILFAMLIATVIAWSFTHKFPH
jgi:hypothetical protein